MTSSTTCTIVHKHVEEREWFRSSTPWDGYGRALCTCFNFLIQSLFTIFFFFFTSIIIKQHTPSNIIFRNLFYLHFLFFNIHYAFLHFFYITSFFINCKCFHMLSCLQVLTADSFLFFLYQRSFCAFLLSFSIMLCFISILLTFQVKLCTFSNYNFI